MPLDMLRYCAKETLDSLAYLHSNAVVHEDLRVDIHLFLSIFIIITIITFCLSRSRGEMCIDHGCLCVCLSVRCHIPTLLHGPGCKLGEW